MPFKRKIFSDRLIRKTLLLGLISVLSYHSLFSQPTTTVIESILKHGNATSLSKYFDQEVNITFFNSFKKYNKAAASKALLAFFAENDPKECSTIGEGGASEHKYYLGQIRTSSSSFKVYILFCARKGNYYIRELRFEK